MFAKEKEGTMDRKTRVSPTGNDFEQCRNCGEQVAWTYDYGWQHSEDTEDCQTPEGLPASLRFLKPGDTVYTVLRHVSRSGMSRNISLIRMDETGPWDITYAAAQIMGRRMAKNTEGMVCGGCGMDMGFDAVYSLARSLWPEGYPCIGEDCPANDHSNGDRDYTPGHAVHKDGGYALKQRWM